MVGGRRGAPVSGRFGRQIGDKDELGCRSDLVLIV